MIGLAVADLEPIKWRKTRRHLIGLKPYRLIPAADRARALEHEDELLDAAQRARREGWREYERDVICSQARRLGVTIWPALADRLAREARATVAAP